MVIHTVCQKGHVNKESVDIISTVVLNSRNRPGKLWLPNKTCPKQPCNNNHLKNSCLEKTRDRSIGTTFNNAKKLFKSKKLIRSFI